MAKRGWNRTLQPRTISLFKKKMQNEIKLERIEISDEKRNTTVEEINNVLKKNSNETLGYTEDPIVSSDIIGSLYGGVVDSLLTSISEVNGKQLVKVVAWYDNEMGYSSQMVRTAKYLMEIHK